jgi:multiple sugar transport system ATP-binding protein
VDGTIVIAQIDRDSPVRVGEVLKLRADTVRLHLFDIESDVSLLGSQ